MARDYKINGESMVAVKSNPLSTIGSLTNLGLSDGPIIWTPNYRHMDIAVDAWGGDQGPPPEIQCFLADVTIRMTLVHFDRGVLEECMRLSLGGGGAEGTLPRAGSRMGNGAARFAAGNNFIGLNISSPVEGRPMRFLFAYLTGPPVEYPVGTRRSVVACNWRAVPYTVDPWNGGVGAQGTVLWDHTSDT